MKFESWLVGQSTCLKKGSMQSPNLCLAGKKLGFNGGTGVRGRGGGEEGRRTKACEPLTHAQWTTTGCV